MAPGSMQAHPVVHCGESPMGLYLSTRLATDVATGWTWPEPVWDEGRARRLPLSTRSVDAWPCLSAGCVPSSGV